MTDQERLEQERAGDERNARANHHKVMEACNDPMGLQMRVKTARILSEQRALTAAHEDRMATIYREAAEYGELKIRKIEVEVLAETVRKDMEAQAKANVRDYWAAGVPSSRIIQESDVKHGLLLCFWHPLSSHRVADRVLIDTRKEWLVLNESLGVSNRLQNGDDVEMEHILRWLNSDYKLAYSCGPFNWVKTPHSPS